MSACNTSPTLRLDTNRSLAAVSKHTAIHVLTVINRWGEGLPLSSEFKINRKLRLPRSEQLDRSSKRRNQQRVRAKHIVRRGHVCAIEHVEQFHHEVQFSVWLHVEIFYESRVQIHRRG